MRWGGPDGIAGEDEYTGIDNGRHKLYTKHSKINIENIYELGSQSNPISIPMERMKSAKVRGKKNFQPSVINWS